MPDKFGPDTTEETVVPSTKAKEVFGRVTPLTPGEALTIVAVIAGLAPAIE